MKRLTRISAGEYSAPHPANPDVTIYLMKIRHGIWVSYFNTNVIQHSFKTLRDARKFYGI